MTEPLTLTHDQWLDAETILAPAFTTIPPPAALHAGYDPQVHRALALLTAAASRDPAADVDLPGRCPCCMTSADGDLCEPCVSGRCHGCAPAHANRSLTGRRPIAARRAAIVLVGDGLGGTLYRCSKCGHLYDAAPDVPDWDIAGSESGVCWDCRPAPRAPLAIEAPVKAPRPRKPRAKPAAKAAGGEQPAAGKSA